MYRQEFLLWEGSSFISDVVFSVGVVPAATTIADTRGDLAKHSTRLNHSRFYKKQIKYFF